MSPRQPRAPPQGSSSWPHGRFWSPTGGFALPRVPALSLPWVPAPWASACRRRCPRRAELPGNLVSLQSWSQAASSSPPATFWPWQPPRGRDAAGRDLGKGLPGWAPGAPWCPLLKHWCAQGGSRAGGSSVGGLPLFAPPCPCPPLPVAPPSLCPVVTPDPRCPSLHPHHRAARWGHRARATRQKLPCWGGQGWHQPDPTLTLPCAPLLSQDAPPGAPRRAKGGSELGSPRRGRRGPTSARTWWGAAWPSTRCRPTRRGSW